MELTTNRHKTKKVVRTAIFVALLFVTSQILIPLPPNPVPINLAVMTVLLAGSLLGPYWGTLSVIVFILLGLIGLPVYSRFGSGASHLVGPTGGFLFGFVPAAFISGLGTYNLSSPQSKTPKFSVAFLSIAMCIGLIFIYAIGTVVFIYSTKQSLNNSLYLTTIPFIFGDTIKIALALAITIKLKKIKILF